MGSRLGDWNCRSCQHLNFSRRDSCQRCGDKIEETNRHLNQYFVFAYFYREQMNNYSGCNEHNFASRMECFRCNAPKEYGNKSLCWEIKNGYY
ncbi:hypothetical protein MKX01_004489 [Papaver californicum]|nr:hypothetical protein MKX01_004489 [Papaver californicum]